jgi:hypothetical protein
MKRSHKFQKKKERSNTPTKPARRTGGLFFKGAKQMQNTQFERVEQMFDLLMKRMDRQDSELKQVKEEIRGLPFEDDSSPKQSDFLDDEIYTKGDRIPYLKLEGENVFEFREFISHIRMNSQNFTEREVDYASFADKNFKDIRISENAKRILQVAYFRLYREPWPFKFIKGYLHKMNGLKAWSWSDGTRD